MCVRCVTRSRCASVLISCYMTRAERDGLRGRLVRVVRVCMSGREHTHMRGFVGGYSCVRTREPANLLFMIPVPSCTLQS